MSRTSDDGKEREEMVRKESIEVFVSEPVEEVLEKEKMEVLATEKMPSSQNFKLDLVRDFITDVKKRTLSSASVLESSTLDKTFIEYRFTFTLNTK